MVSKSPHGCSYVNIVAALHCLGEASSSREIVEEMVALGSLPCVRTEDIRRVSSNLGNAVRGTGKKWGIVRVSEGEYCMGSL